MTTQENAGHTGVQVGVALREARIIDGPSVDYLLQNLGRNAKRGAQVEFKIDKPIIISHEMKVIIVAEERKGAIQWLRVSIGGLQREDDSGESWNWTAVATMLTDDKTSMYGQKKIIDIKGHFNSRTRFGHIQFGKITW